MRGPELSGHDMRRDSRGQPGAVDLVRPLDGGAGVARHRGVRLSAHEGLGGCGGRDVGRLHAELLQEVEPVAVDVGVEGLQRVGLQAEGVGDGGARVARLHSVAGGTPAGSGVADNENETWWEVGGGGGGEEEVGSEGGRGERVDQPDGKHHQQKRNRLSKLVWILSLHLLPSCSVMLVVLTRWHEGSAVEEGVELQQGGVGDAKHGLDALHGQKQEKQRKRQGGQARGCGTDSARDARGCTRSTLQKPACWRPECATHRARVSECGGVGPASSAR